MTKRRSKVDKIGDCFTAFKCIKEGKPINRDGAKDGSVATHSVVPVSDLPEADVKEVCLKWLKHRGVFCAGHDCGSGDFGFGYATYGIKASGDIHGMLKYHGGKHFELELKKGTGGRQSKGQQKRMRNVRANNGLYFIVHGVEELEYYMGELV